MNILVIGSEGQIGKPLCEFLKEQGNTVFEADINAYLPNRLDASDPKLLDDYYYNRIVGKGPKNLDRIIFLAFNVGGSNYLKKHDKTFDNIDSNVRLMSNVFNYFKDSGIPLLFASSQMSDMLHTNYGFLKNLGERYCKSLGMHFCRFWNVYGKENPMSEKAHVITDFLWMAKRDKKIQMKTSGKEERQFLHVDDCSRAIYEWCKDPSKFDPKIPLDITSFEWNTIHDVASIISEFTGCEIIQGEDTDSIQVGIKNQPDHYFQVTSGWKPEISLWQGIKGLL